MPGLVLVFCMPYLASGGTMVKWAPAVQFSVRVSRGRRKLIDSGTEQG